MHRSSSLLLLLLARRTTSETASARRARGIDAAEGGRFAEGCDALLGLELKENDAEAFFWAGWALRRRALAQHDDAAALGDLDAAAAHLGRAVAAAPAHAVARFYHGDALVDAGRVAAGAAEMRRALAEDPDSFDATATSKLGTAERLSRLAIEQNADACAAPDDAPDAPPLAVAWDDALPAALVARVRAEAPAHQEYLAENAAGVTSFWVPASAIQTPKTAVERVLAALRPLAAAGAETLGAGDLRDLAGCEFWIRQQHPKKGVAAHYDLDVETARRTKVARSPVVSSVVYLSDVGGPTWVVDRETGPTVDDGSLDGPAPPRAAYVPPAPGRFLVFPGRKLHGVQPAADDRGLRATLLVNWWRSKPLAPACAEATLGAAVGAVDGAPKPRRVGVAALRASGFASSLSYAATAVPCPDPDDARTEILVYSKP